MQKNLAELLAPYTTVYIAGYGNSLEGHWQRQWYHDTPNSLWVEQKNWDCPNKQEWLESLNHTLTSTTTVNHQAVEKPVFIIAHSLGCNTLVEWVGEKLGRNTQDLSRESTSKNRTPHIRGALLVAYPDVVHKSFPEAIKGYSSPPLRRLPFPTLAIASTSDPYIRDYKQVEFYADAWGSKLVNVGDVGHINAASELGDWPQGKQILEAFVTTI